MPFLTSLMASGCVVTVVLIKAEPGSILTVINDGEKGRHAQRTKKLDFDRFGQLNK